MATNSVVARPVNMVPENVGGVLLGDQYQHPLLQEFANDPVVSRLRGAFAAYRESLDNVKAALRTADPTRTPEGHFLEVSKVAKKRLVECGERGTSAASFAKLETEAIDNDIAKQLDIAESRHAGEIRQHFKSLSDADRLSAARKAAAEGDSVTMGAILSGPAFLSGFSDAERATIRTLYTETHAPDLLKRKRAIAMALGVNDRANMAAIEAASTLFPPSKIAEIESRTAEAQAAKASI